MKKSGLSPGASGLGAGPDGGGNSAFLVLPQNGVNERAFCCLKRNLKEW